ncbi:4Fe-4S double cluster binding domain-containing protein [Chloroflexota bacterium]
MELQSKLEKEAKAMGAAYFGVANLSQAQKGPVNPYEQKLMAEYPLAVSIGVPVSTSVVDRIGDQSDHLALHTYRFHIYQVISPLIDQISLRICFMLASEGYTAMPVPASQPLDVENHRGIFSNKLPASLAGLGWIGKSCLLITPDRGPRVRWGTVLTNAPLEAGAPVETRCGTCRECVEACPVGAFTGRDFVPSEGREMRMMAQKCHDFLTERRKTIGANTCGMCVYVCPWGSSKSAENNLKS